MIALGFSRSQTSVSCGPLKAVLRNSTCAPSFEQATSVSTKPRWLRIISPTLSPSLTPASDSACAIALERSWISRKVTVPRSSMTAVLSGMRAAAAL